MRDKRSISRWCAGLAVGSIGARVDHDGKISLVESERARLGIVDARLEEIAEEGGVKGAIAEAAHKVLDKLDNDER